MFSDESAFVPNDVSGVPVLDSYSIPVSNTFIAKKNWKLAMSICDQITPNYKVDIEIRPGLEKIRQVGKHQ